MFHEGGQTRKHCFLAMRFLKVDKHGYIFPSHVSRRWANQERLFADFMDFWLHEEVKHILKEYNTYMLEVHHSKFHPPSTPVAHCQSV